MKLNAIKLHVVVLHIFVLPSIFMMHWILIICKNTYAPYYMDTDNKQQRWKSHAGKGGVATLKKQNSLLLNHFMYHCCFIHAYHCHSLQAYRVLLKPQTSWSIMKSWAESFFFFFNAFKSPLAFQKKRSKNHDLAIRLMNVSFPVHICITTQN